jgi:hypothetical protein
MWLMVYDCRLANNMGLEQVRVVDGETSMSVFVCVCVCVCVCVWYAYNHPCTNVHAKSRSSLIHAYMQARAETVLHILVSVCIRMRVCAAIIHGTIACT